MIKNDILLDVCSGISALIRAAEVFAIEQRERAEVVLRRMAAVYIRSGEQLNLIITKEMKS